MLKKFLPQAGLFIAVIILGLFFVFPVFSQSAVDKYQEIQKKIAEVSAKISDLQKIERDLSEQITYINSQITLTELRIEEAQARIDQLEKEIGVLGFRIGYITDSANRLEVLLKQRIVATYQQSFISNIELLLTSRDFSDLILRLQYVKQVQENDKKILADLQTTKANYSNQKEEREDKQAQIEELKKKLDATNLVLASQKREKDEFLRITQNDEKKYQEELRKLQADAASISQAIGNIGYKIGSVNKGEVIANVGSSGCSTGPHLHLEVYTDAKVEKVGDSFKIIGNRVDPEPYLNDGKYERPVPYNPPPASAKYGIQYFLGFHTGFDIPHPFGTLIKAMDSGDAYFTSAACNLSIPGGTPLGKGIVVDHKNGLVTLYWHIP